MSRGQGSGVRGTHGDWEPVGLLYQFNTMEGDELTANGLQIAVRYRWRLQVEDDGGGYRWSLGLEASAGGCSWRLQVEARGRGSKWRLQVEGGGYKWRLQVEAMSGGYK